jgi:hypothetical protein
MNTDTRPEHQNLGFNVYRLEPYPYDPWRGPLTRMGLARGGFELHIGSRTLGCINADKTNPQAVQQYHDIDRMLQFENGSNFLTVTP